MTQMNIPQNAENQGFHKLSFFFASHHFKNPLLMPETGSNFGQGFFVVLAPGSDVQIKLKANTLGSEIFLRCPHLFQPYIYLII